MIDHIHDNVHKILREDFGFSVLQDLILQVGGQNEIWYYTRDSIVVVIDVYVQYSHHNRENIYVDINAPDFIKFRKEINEILNNIKKELKEYYKNEKLIETSNKLFRMFIKGKEPTWKVEGIVNGSSIKVEDNIIHISFLKNLICLEGNYQSKDIEIENDEYSIAFEKARDAITKVFIDEKET